MFPFVWAVCCTIVKVCSVVNHSEIAMAPQNCEICVNVAWGVGEGCVILCFPWPQGDVGLRARWTVLLLAGSTTRDLLLGPKGVMSGPL